MSNLGVLNYSVKKLQCVVSRRLYLMNDDVGDNLTFVVETN
jgi:hypothetical protein